MINGFVGDVNLENRLQKAARNIPQPQQMRAYSTTSHASNALRKSRPSRRTPLVSSTRSYATQTTNPNPPFGRLFSINPLATFYLRLIRLQVLRTAPIKRHQKLPLSVSMPIPWILKDVPDHAQAPGVTPGKVWDIPLQFKQQSWPPDALQLPKALVFPVSLYLARCLKLQCGEGVADCEIVISLDQPAQWSSTYGFTSCERFSW